MVSVCQECKGTTFAQEDVRLIFDDKERLCIVDGVPATVCKQCGAKYFTPTVLRCLEGMKTAPADTVLPVDVVHFRVHSATLSASQR